MTAAARYRLAGAAMQLGGKGDREALLTATRLLCRGHAIGDPMTRAAAQRAGVADADGNATPLFARMAVEAARIAKAVADANAEANASRAA